MKTRFKIIIIVIVVASILFGTYQSIMYQCGTLPVFMETPRTPALWKCLDIWKHQSEQPQPQSVLSNPICLVVDRSTSGETGSAVTMDRCFTLSEFEEMGCTTPMLEHLNKYSNLLDYELDGTWYLEYIGLPSGMSIEDFDKCVDVILEKRPILNPDVIPEPGPLKYQILSKDKVLSKGTGFDLPKDTFTEDELRELEQHEKELRKILDTQDLSYEEKAEISSEINSMQDRLSHPFQTGTPYHLVKMIKERYSVLETNFSELEDVDITVTGSNQISHVHQALRIGIHPDHFSLPELKQQDQTIREYLGGEMNILYEKVLVVPSDEN